MPISDTLRAEIERASDLATATPKLRRALRDTLLHFATHAAEEATERCIDAVEAEFRAEENRLMESDRLHGGVHAGVGQRVTAPLIEKSADLAAARMLAVAAIRRQRIREKGGPK